MEGMWAVGNMEKSEERLESGQIVLFRSNRNQRVVENLVKRTLCCKILFNEGRTRRYDGFHTVNCRLVGEGDASWQIKQVPCSVYHRVKVLNKR